MKSVFFFLCLFGASLIYAQQPINGYAKVTGVAGTTLTVSNVDETYDTFESGERIIILQVQDDVLGNTTNTASFGSIGSIQSAGLFESVDISSVTESGGVPTSITVSSPLVNSYNTCANCSVQIITYPQLDDGDGNYTTTEEITALDWGGDIGGVIALRVTDTLKLAHNINADFSGFRGGGRNPTNDGSNCQAGTYITNSDRYGYKGEGIYKNTTANYTYARAKIINGGGGGNPHNSGGGGGGNFTAGGNAGPGWNCGGSPAHGFGGIDLSDQISGTRLYLGGGGGGGQGNNGVATDGGDGGGLIFIAANTIETASCGGFTISANGESIPQAGNDGGGGGGAGGSVLVNVTNGDLDCTLNIEANGGTGGSVGDAGQHGGGGGGGKGVLIFSSAVGGVPNLNTNNSQGVGGANQTGGGATTADDGDPSPSSPTADPDGVVETEDNPLPVELLYWEGEYANGGIQLAWATASEQDNHFFTIERSYDMKDWDQVANVQGAGQSSVTREYELEDTKVSRKGVYYRLTQTDFDGTREVFESIYIEVNDFLPNLVLFPNPNDGRFKINIQNTAEYELSIIDLNGREQSYILSQKANMVDVDVSHLQEGVYLVKVTVGNQSNTYQFIKR